MLPFPVYDAHEMSKLNVSAEAFVPMRVATPPGIRCDSLFIPSDNPWCAVHDVTPGCVRLWLGIERHLIVVGKFASFDRVCDEYGLIYPWLRNLRLHQVNADEAIHLISTINAAKHVIGLVNITNPSFRKKSDWMHYIGMETHPRVPVSPAIGRAIMTGRSLYTCTHEELMTLRSIKAEREYGIRYNPWTRIVEIIDPHALTQTSSL